MMTSKPAKLMRVDLETFSSVDLKKSGLYPYTEADDHEIMLFGYKVYLAGVLQGPRRVVDLTPARAVQMRLRRTEDPKHRAELLQALFPEDPIVVEALLSDDWEFSAFNAAFERVNIRAAFKLAIHPKRWHCTMVHALTAGLPSDLARVATVMNVKVKKDPIGRKFITYFCKPCKPTKANGQRTRNWPSNDPDLWAAGARYCGDDVDGEDEVANRLEEHVPMHPRERRGYVIDQIINDKGVAVDLPLIDAAIEADIIAKRVLTAEAVRLTGISNPNSVKQLAAWLNKQSEDEFWTSTTVDKINKKTLPGLLLQFEGTVAEQVLRLRIELAKTSITKYTAMRRWVCRDGRIRGIHQFYGANRTGRWAGRGVQFQNMVTNRLRDERKTSHPDYVDLLATARRALLAGGYDLLSLLFGNVTYILSQLVRTAIIAEPGNTLAPIDFKQIEARGLAWKARVKWRMNVFETGQDIYVASAMQMFRLTAAAAAVKEVRQKGKVAELALGYQGAVNALILMGALDMGIPEGELVGIVQAWRAASPEIKALWYAFDDAAMDCVRTGKSQLVQSHRFQFAGKTTFRMHRNCLFMKLESGRELCYVRPKVELGRFGECVTYEGLDQKTKQWRRIEGSPGKWVENWDQAFCRDLLLDKLFEFEDAGLLPFVAFHVHDEIVSEIPVGRDLMPTFTTMFSRPVRWAPGLPLAGDGYLTPFYRKED